MFRRTQTILLLTLLFSVPAHAGSQGDPEMTDPADDRNETPAGMGCVGPAGTDASFPDVDLIGAWFDGTTDVGLHIQTQAAVAADTALAISFQVARGPASVFASTASGATHTIETNGATLTSGPATAIAQNGAVLSLTIPRAAIGASGGDVLQDLRITSSRTVPAGPGGVCPAQTGTDVAPNNGASRAFTLSRPAVVADAAFTLQKATLHETVNGTTASREVTVFETRDANATIELQLAIKNTGTDADVQRYALVLPGRIAGSVAPTQAGLDPGATTQIKVVLDLKRPAPGTHNVVLRLTSERGADITFPLPITVLAPPSPAPTPTPTPTAAPEPGRMPAIGAGTFLQDAAEAVRFDGPFGEQAEVVLVAVAILVLILLVFLAIALAGHRWVRVSITPRTITAGPGETAEFQVDVRNRRRRFSDALAYFDGDANWKTGLVLKPEGDGDATPLDDITDEAELSLAPKAHAGGRMRGTLRVQVPEDAGHDSIDAVQLNIVPLDDGQQMPRHRGRATARVRAHNPGVEPVVHARNSVPVRLSEVRHEPREPSSGDQVTTQATIENDSHEETQRLRVVLQLDGRDTAEQTVDVPPKSARTVLFPWVAGEGNNRVRVQVYLA